MTTRTKNTLWFAIPTLVTAVALAAITIPSIEEVGQEIGSQTLAEPIVALVIFAGIGGAIVGGLFYGIRKLLIRSQPK